MVSAKLTVFIRGTVREVPAQISGRETLRKSKETEQKYISVKEKLGGGSPEKVNDLLCNFGKGGKAREDRILTISRRLRNKTIIKYTLVSPFKETPMKFGDFSKSWRGYRSKEN